MKRPSLAALAILCVALLSLVESARAEDPILYWNSKILDATRLSRCPPPLAALFLANYHVAIFDAVNGVTHTDKSLIVDGFAPPGTNLDAAIAGAAHAVLKAQWSQIMNERVIEISYEEALAAIPDGEGKTAGLAWGKLVAERLLAKRTDCGYDKPIPGKYSSDETGKWRETPPQFRPPLLPFWPHVTPFVMTSSAQFRCPPPLPIGSAEYAAELAFVAKVGPRDGAERTEYQTLCTPFWSDDLGTATPPGHWNSIAETIVRRKKLSTPDSARLFALLDLAEADAGISCWETKYYYRSWRPETALRELDTKTNPNVTPRPDFIPNMPSPPFPAYTSGHSTFSAAATRILERFFGTDEIAFDATSDGLPGTIHHFDRLSDARREVGMSRVWGGIHTMTDNLEGQKAGLKVADWVFDHALQPAQ